MKTQRLNLLEAMNFALAGHEVKSYKDGYTIKLKNGYLALYHKDFNRGIMLTGSHIIYRKHLQWHCGDDRTIKGYYEEE